MKTASKTKGITCIIISAFCFAFMNTFVRMAGDLPSVEKSFFRNFVALIFAAVMLLRTEEKFRFDKKNLPYLLLRAFFGTVGILGNFYAIDHLVLADASMLNKLSPFFAIIFSFIILREKVNIWQSLAVVIAFVGALFIIKPTGVSFNSASLAGVIGGVGAGIAYTMVRLLSKRGERGAFIVFFFSAFSCLTTLPLMLADFRPMAWWQLLSLLGAGLAATGGQFAITAAYSYAPAKEISEFDYTQIIFVAVLGLIFFSELPDIFSIIGYLIIILVSICMFLYERNMKS